MQPGAADEAGPLAVLGRMTDEAGRLVDDQQILVLKNDVEQLFHRRESCHSPPKAERKI